MARPTLMKHPKFRRLAHLLGEPAPHVRGYLELLWEVAYQSGDPAIGDATDVELAAEYPGEPGKLAAALSQVRLIDEVAPGRYAVHDLADHAPDYVRERARKESQRNKNRLCHCGAVFHSSDPRAAYCSDACRQAAYRARRVTDPHGRDRNAPANVAACYGSLQSVTESDGTPTPAPSPTPVTETACAVFPETPDGVVRDANPPAPAEAILNFPTDGEKREWHLTAAHVAEWSAAYPSLDVLGECRKALAWINAAPSRRKTARGMPRFLVGWLGRTQDSPRRNGPPPAEANGQARQKDVIARLLGEKGIT